VSVFHRRFSCRSRPNNIRRLYSGHPRVGMLLGRSGSPWIIARDAYCSRKLSRPTRAFPVNGRHPFPGGESGGDVFSNDVTKKQISGAQHSPAREARSRRLLVDRSLVCRTNGGRKVHCPDNQPARPAGQERNRFRNRPDRSNEEARSSKTLPTAGEPLKI